jgi:hypothetical protein
VGEKYYSKSSLKKEDGEQNSPFSLIFLKKLNIEKYIK